MTAASVDCSVCSSHSMLFDVQVVGRLVEQEQVGVAAERARERGARQLPARERVQLPVEVGVGETEAAQRRVHALAPGVAARMLEARLRLGVAAERRGLVFAGGHRLLEARPAPARSRSGRRRRRARIRAGTAPARAAVAGRAARSASPSRRRARRRAAPSRPPGSGATSSCRSRSDRTGRAGHAARP